MKKGEVEVTSKNVPGHEGVSVVIKKIEYPIFETIQEAAQELGEQTCVELLTTQNRTNLMNAVRAEATGKPSRKSLEEEAWRRITVDELQSAAGDPAKIRAVQDKYIAIIEEELKAKRGAALAAGAQEAAAQEEQAA